MSNTGKVDLEQNGIYRAVFDLTCKIMANTGTQTKAEWLKTFSESLRVAQGEDVEKILAGAAVPTGEFCVSDNERAAFGAMSR